MTMPIETIFVRHGESKGNVANRLSRQGDSSLFTEEFRARHSSNLRLSARGRDQAVIAGQWLKREFFNPYGFDRHWVSTYIRAKETAGLLDLPDASWYEDFNLREREWGELDTMPDDERREKFSQAMAMQLTEPFLWRPLNGESIAELCLRERIVLDTLHRECSDKRVVIVCHGEVMWAYRVILERISPDRYKELDVSQDPFNRIHNCQILHYTRRNPTNGQIVPYPTWFRSVCPWDLSLSLNQWQEIKRPKYSNADLLKSVHRIPSILKSPEK